MRAGAEALGGTTREPSRVFLTWGNCALRRGLRVSLLPIKLPEQSWSLRAVLPAGEGEEAHSPHVDGAAGDVGAGRSNDL